ncbi:MAG: helix-turn-helix domain-containing protein [Gammaproteobacteria bacterium]|nr:helix-turn-helix domain-containing protein [Gammaproteobacteria bacterium]
MVEKKKRFDLEGFYSVLDGTRIARGKTWKEVAAETEVSESTLSRMRTGQRPDAGSLASLAAWSGLNPADFVTGTRTEAAEPLAQISAFLHSDPRLSKEGADMIDGLVKSTYERIVKKR